MKKSLYFLLLIFVMTSFIPVQGQSNLVEMVMNKTRSELQKFEPGFTCPTGEVSCTLYTVTVKEAPGREFDIGVRFQEPGKTRVEEIWTRFDAYLLRDVNYPISLVGAGDLAAEFFGLGNEYRIRIEPSYDPDYNLYLIFPDSKVGCIVWTMIKGQYTINCTKPYTNFDELKYLRNF